MSRDRAKELTLNIKGQPGTTVLAAIGGNLPPGWIACDLSAHAQARDRGMVSVFCSAKRLGEPFSVGVGAKLEVDADNPDTAVCKDGHPEEVDLLRVADQLAMQLRDKVHALDLRSRGNRVRIKLDTGAQLPERKTAGASGYDLCAIGGCSIQPGRIVKISTGVHLELPPGTEAQVRPRSGLAMRGLWVHFATVDSDYRGECRVIAANLTTDPISIGHGDRIAQLVFASVLTPELEVCEELSETERGECGLGSTGK